MTTDSPTPYRLLRRGETSRQGDEVLGDDAVSWLPLAGWEIGVEYDPAAHQPIRREQVIVNNG